MGEFFDLGGDRGLALQQTAILAKLRAVELGAADRLAAEAQAEPDPTAVHIGILRRNFPALRFLHGGWPCGLPNLRDLTNLAVLRAQLSENSSLPRFGVMHNFREVSRK